MKASSLHTHRDGQSENTRCGPVQASGTMKQTEASLLALRLGEGCLQATLRTRLAAPSRPLIHFAHVPGIRYVLSSNSPFLWSSLVDKRGHERENANNPS
jgi:hypothetical protein